LRIFEESQGNDGKKSKKIKRRVATGRQLLSAGRAEIVGLHIIIINERVNLEEGNIFPGIFSLLAASTPEEIIDLRRIFLIDFRQT
jgi:hypothetical protein